MPHVPKSKPIAEDHPPPTWLDKEAKKMWRKIIEDNAKIQLITENDLPALARYCNAHSKYIEAERHAHPAVILKKIRVKLKKGFKIVEQYVPNPWIKIARDYAKEAERNEIRFGFSPVDRVKTGIPLPNEEDEDDFTKFLKRKKA